MRHLLATATVLAGLVATAHADGHRRVVILRFDGPAQLADDARELVMDAAGHDNDVVALGRWADAHKAATRKLRGAKAWAKSSRDAQVDAIIEGTVRRGRRGYQLELVVREAATGNQVDSVELQVDDDRKAERTIEGELTDLLAWVEPPVERREVLRLDRGRDRDDRDARDDRWDDGDARDDRDDDRATTRDWRGRDRDDDRATTRDRRDRDDDRTTSRDRRDRDGDRTAGRDRDDDRRDRDDDRTASRDRDDRRDDDRRDDDRRDRDDRRGDDLGFAADTDADRDLELDGGRDRDLADETVALLDGEPGRGRRDRDPAAARPIMLRVAGGGYVTSRSLGFTSADGGATPGGDGGHPTMGVQLRADLFPFGETGAGGRLTGLGLHVDVARALGNKVAAQVDGATAQLGVDQSAWTAAVAYRRVLAPATVQLDLGYGHTGQTIVDKPMTVAVVDASYGYVRGGARAELPVGRKATVGAGAHYLYLTSAPEMQKLGAPSATGFDADASIEVPITASLTAVGGLDYQRISLTFAGTGTATDSFLSARLGLGISY